MIIEKDLLKDSNSLLNEISQSKDIMKLYHKFCSSFPETVDGEAHLYECLEYLSTHGFITKPSMEKFDKNVNVSYFFNFTNPPEITSLGKQYLDKLD